MQLQLMHNEKIAALGRVTAQVAHELKNPLTGLGLYSLYLREKVADLLPPGDVSLVDSLIECVEHLNKTANQILDFARPQMLKARKVNWGQSITSVVRLLEPHAAAQGVKLSVALNGADAEVLLDDVAVRSALINLILNAIQSMPDGGALSVEARRPTSVDGTRRESPPTRSPAHLGWTAPRSSGCWSAMVSRAGRTHAAHSAIRRSERLPDG